MKRVLTVLLTVILTSFWACTTAPVNIQKTTEGEIPEWFLNPPKDDNYVFAVATEASQDMQMAVTKAKTTAAAEVSRTLDMKVKNMEKNFKQETGVGENSELLQDAVTATKSITSSQLSGLTEAKKALVKDGAKWRAYVMMQYPTGAAADAFMKSLKKSEKVYAQFKATQAFQELDKEVKEYEEFKEKQK